jgi:hypothetical protein
MAAELTRLTHKIAIQLHLVAETCTICISHSRRPAQKLLDTPSYIDVIKVYSFLLESYFCVSNINGVQGEVISGSYAVYICNLTGGLLTFICFYFCFRKRRYKMEVPDSDVIM